MRRCLDGICPWKFGSGFEAYEDHTFTYDIAL